MKSIHKLLTKSHKLIHADHIKNKLKILTTCNRHFSNIDLNSVKRDVQNGPGLKDFIKSDTPLNNNIDYTEDQIPYINNTLLMKERRKVYFDVYGCQMNVNDTEVVWSILKNNNFLKTDVLEEADVILLITCAIRDGAEQKIWRRIAHLRGLKRKKSKSKPHMKIGILGCMAERLKHQLIEKEKSVDLVAGPDSYKDLPRLLALTENNQTAINVILSLDETYADIMPVRLNEDSKTAFVSIMRGCDNMCTYCIVPFTRGRERSRPIDSIIEEIKHLSEQGVKQVTLLGQNVNSYRDLSLTDEKHELTKMSKGFQTVYKTKKGGVRFADLLDKVSLVDPEMRIRFTSPHPKDFPDEVLQLIKERKNICEMLHLPAQSGSTTVLERMRRGYTRESYLELVDHIRSILPGVSLSSDFISGFCHETEEEFLESISLIEMVKYNCLYMFPYSMREKTTAHRRYKDDIPDDVKLKRHMLMAEVYRKTVERVNCGQIGEIQLVLMEGFSKKSESMLSGRNDGNTKVIIPAIDIPSSEDSMEGLKISPGDYIAVKIDSANSQVLKGTPIYHTTLSSFKGGFNEHISKRKAITNI